MLKCNGKTFMNLQEAVQWLLNNNALFFMCDENYVADTEISLEELVNPSPANPKIGSLVLFADGKISPITGITDDSFIVGSDYTDIRLVKSVTHFSIDASQHLIVHYTDGTSDDLGAIFSGDVHIAGTLTADKAKILEQITDSNGNYRFIEGDVNLEAAEGITKSYGRWSLSGTHLMIVLALEIVTGTTISDNQILSHISLPQFVYDKIAILFGSTVSYYTPSALATDYTSISFGVRVTKANDLITIRKNITVTTSKTYNVRIQCDFLIDDNFE